MKPTNVFYLKWKMAEQQQIQMLLSPNAWYAYTMLLAYDGAGIKIPYNVESMAAFSRVPRKAITELLDKCPQLFFVEDGQFHNIYVQEAKNKAEALSAKRSESGKRGMASRWNAAPVNGTGGHDYNDDPISDSFMSDLDCP